MPTETAASTEVHMADVRVLEPHDTDAAAELIARGFAEEPGNVALLPDPGRRRVLLEVSARNALRWVLPYGSVHAVAVGDDLAAIAVWHPPGVSRSPVGGLVHAIPGMLAVAPTVVRTVPHAASVLVRTSRQGRHLVRARRRAVTDASKGLAWHLGALATAPEHRGQGLARMLLERQLARCDQDGAAAWLETTDPVNPPIYERFGFSTVAHIEQAAWLPGLWVMRREPLVEAAHGGSRQAAP